MVSLKVAFYTEKNIWTDSSEFYYIRNPYAVMDPCLSDIDVPPIHMT